MTERACETCGGPLPPPKIPAPPRRFCSERCRKQQYAGTCIDCGAPTDGSNGRSANASKRCVKCAPVHSRIWGSEEIIAAIQAWADEHDGIPPAATDWHRFTPDRRWPYSASVVERFGTWNAAIQVAGFVPRPVGCYGRDGEDPAVIAETVRLYRSGLSSYKIAELHGCTAEGVRYRLEKAEEPRRHSGWTRSKAA